MENSTSAYSPREPTREEALQGRIQNLLYIHSNLVEEGKPIAGLEPAAELISKEVNRWTAELVKLFN